MRKGKSGTGGVVPIPPSRVHRARGCDRRGSNAQPGEPETCSEQAFRALAQVSATLRIGLITRRSRVQIPPPLLQENPGTAWVFLCLRPAVEEPMPDAVPHRYHSSAEFCSAGGLCDWWPLPAEPALSVNVPKPCLSTFRVRPQARSAFGLRTDGSRLEPEGLEGCPKALRRGRRKGRVRGSSGADRGTRKLAQSPSAGRVPERAGWHRLRLASPRMRTSRVPPLNHLWTDVDAHGQGLGDLRIRPATSPSKVGDLDTFNRPDRLRMPRSLPDHVDFVSSTFSRRRA